MARTRPVPPPLAVTPANAAAMLDCSRAHVYNLCERGVLRRVHIAGSTSVRIPVEDIYAAVGLAMVGGGPDASA